MFKSKEQKLKEKREEKENELKIDRFSEKCNFLDADGSCNLCGQSFYKGCDFDDCIFMKILSQKQTR